MWHVLQRQTRPFYILCHFRVLLQAKVSDISMSLFVRNDTGLHDFIRITYHKTGTTMLYDTHFNYHTSRYGPILGKHQIDGLVQDCIISSALAVEILKSCINPSKYHVFMIHIWIIFFFFLSQYETWSWNDQRCIMLSIYINWWAGYGWPT